MINWIKRLLLWSVFILTLGIFASAELAVMDQAGYIMVLEAQVTNLQTELSGLYNYNIKPIHYKWLERYCKEHKLDFDFMVRLMLVESNDNPNAKSNRYAYGLMQVQWPTAFDIDGTLISRWQLYDPQTNIRIGTAYFRELLDMFDGDYRLAALAYNMGPTRLAELLAEGKEPFDGYYRKIGGMR